MVRGDVPMVGERDYRNYVGDGTGTSIVEICLNWIAAQFPEAPPALWTKKPDGQLERIRDHSMLDLLEEPNFDPAIGRSWYTWVHLIMATLISWNVDGNAYWLKIRNRFGEVIQLWYVPHWLIKPAFPWDGTRYVTAYEYRPSGQLLVLKPQDVVHLRFGIDPEDTRLGWSQLKGELKQVASDEQRAQFTFTILKNLGFPGVVIAPEAMGEETQEIEDPEAVKDAYMRKFTGNRRGEPLVMKGPTKITPFGFDPKTMDLGGIADIAEERITAALRVPAAIAGFGAGLEQATTNATVRELRALAWEQKLIPDGRILASDIRSQLATEWWTRDQLKKIAFGFDLMQVRALQDDENKKAEKWKILVGGGIAEVAEARAAHDLPVRPEDHVRLQPISVEPIGEGAPELPPPAPMPPALPPGSPPALGPGATPPAAQPPKEFLAALQSLRLAAKRIETEGARDDQTATVLAAMEKARSSSDATMLAGLTKLAEAIASRPVDVTIIEAQKTGELREVIERDERGGAQKVRVTPLPVGHKNGDGGGTT